MIRVENLRKIYISRKFKVAALDGVSFTLPDAGMVFVVGKSGSGKSTLLNLLGGLDEATSGEICVDGICFSQMRGEKSFDGFRAHYLGFIFQDFHLVDRLTVGENVGFALELDGENNAAKVSEALRQVGLEGYEKRYPAEMSGGQQQRVAIARALVKDPRLILADEPTGNLDSATSMQIFEQLKLLSKDRLVVVVSHNMEYARQFADRLIEMGDGKIVSDVTRTDVDSDEIVKDGAILLGDGALSDDDIQKIDEAIKTGGITSAKRASKFAPTEDIAPPCDESAREADSEREECEVRRQSRKGLANKSGASGRRDGAARAAKPARLSFGRSVKMSFRFLRKGGLFASVVVAAFLIVLFVICMTLYVFDGGEIIRDAALNEEYPIIFQQQNEDVGAVGIRLDKLVKVEDGAEQALRDAGYKGKIYPLINMGVPTRGSTNLEGAKMLGGMEMYKDIYSAEGLGVIIADEEYLHRYFGDFEVLSGALDAAPYGIIVTDYLADSMLYYDPTMVSPGEDPYAKLVTTKHFRQRIKINAVISTGYKQRYAEMFDKYKEITKDGVVTAIERNDITGSEMFTDFLEDAQSRLNIAYTINSDYMQAVLDNPAPSKYFARCLNADVKVDGKTIYDNFTGYGICASTLGGIPVKLNRGEAYVSVSFYNKLFGTEFTIENIKDNLEERSYTVREYATDDVTRQQPLYEKTFTVKGIYGQDEYMYISDEDFREMRQFDVFAYALVLDNEDGIDKVMTAAEEQNLLPNATLYSDLLLLTKVMKVYRDVFLTIAVVLLGAGFLVLVSFSVKNVSGRTYEIGILRALGASEGQVTLIFVLQTLFAGLLICVLEIAAQFAMLSLTNGLLTTSLAVFMHNGTFKGMTLLRYNPVISLLSLGAMALITLVSVVAPLVKLSRIKPIEILRAKD